MKHIGNLQPAAGSKHKDKRIGRGPGSGHGGSATRGTKGHQSRSGYHRKLAFEGGQMPLIRRIPKFGFNNRNRVEYQVVNLATIQDFIDRGKITSDEIDVDLMFQVGLIGKKNQPVKILGDGNIAKPITIKAHKFSKSAVEKIESVGGKIAQYE
ncbi:50S ribosomal protein L15 [Bacteroidetes/Chlorobi group bacterium MS-B_bin-24]|jgi:large subunit ribosomal protein L15|nr:MAG: 50S ribosomal protein L15 [Bacteroidetes/Chlorobi group bacterium MS-B_bin-24]